MSWKLQVEHGRQVWTWQEDSASKPAANVRVDSSTANIVKTTPKGIPYNGLPFMTSGMVYTHMLPNGSPNPMPLDEALKRVDVSQIRSVYDEEHPITLADIDNVAAKALTLTNPNTGDDVYRKQAIPPELYKSGSSSASNATKRDIRVALASSPDAKLAAEFTGSAAAETKVGDKTEVEIDMTNFTSEQIEKMAVLAGRAGSEFFKHVQADDGHIPGDYGGPMFLMPGAVITCYATGTHLPAPHKLEMIKYILAHQRPEGGWGLHIESNSTMFGTCLNYVTLRILGCPKDLPALTRAREWIHKNGGAQGIPSWGKFWLAVMNVFPWEGCNSIFPELWLLPYKLPLYPGRYWCHCRMVYLPMAYISGVKFQIPENDLIRELRTELYTQPYESMDWPSYRSFVADTDKYTEQSLMLTVSNFFLNAYETYFPKNIFRPKALQFIIDYVCAEDKQTNYVDIGPVNKFINMLCCFHRFGRDSLQFRLHQSRIVDYLWVAEDGMKCQGYNGSQLWDTAFTVQAFLEYEEGAYLLAQRNAGKNVASKDPAQQRALVNGIKSSLQTSPLKDFFLRAYDYVEMSQVIQEVDEREKFFRHVSVGGWPFSTRDHGWPISDCTAEGYKAAAYLHKWDVVTPAAKNYINEVRMQNAMNVILTLQNYQDGGWATYENMRGPAWLEMLNPSEVFGGIMVDYSYVECSSACIQALITFSKMQPHHRTQEIKKSIEDGVSFVKRIQRPDGSWVGSWGVCFTYAAWFGVEALSMYGETYETSKELQMACAFLLSKQNPDGGWGESFLSCVTKEYSYSFNKDLIAAGQESKSNNDPVSMVINTAWALLALLGAGYHKVDRKPIDRAIRFLLSRQMSNGDWPQEGISGVFNGNCMITYTAYRSLFPIWAIGRYLAKVAEL